jgi:hypothetical protein
MKSDLFVYIYGMLQLRHKTNNYLDVIISEIHMILHFLYYLTFLQIENLHLNLKLSNDHKAKGDVG